MFGYKWILKVLGYYSLSICFEVVTQILLHVGRIIHGMDYYIRMSIDVLLLHWSICFVLLTLLLDGYMAS